ncbi:glycosyl hydrolase family 61-domain-containing protein [Aspergillus cavernicola]|uniref:AA9 family lytic polysaccharide monooxygenase n=1 Tax=Aspergillus cavernicola TaxID=176166 RepID=A0ABR4HZT1_9EURO
MSKATTDDVTTYDGSGGLVQGVSRRCLQQYIRRPGNEDWCTWDKDTVLFNIPTDMPAGQYLVRVKHIGLDRAFSGNVEFYFTCAQIEVTGSGTGSPTEVAQIPGIYNPDDANINLNIYYPVPVLSSSTSTALSSSSPPLPQPLQVPQRLSPPRRQPPLRPLLPVKSSSISISSVAGSTGHVINRQL